MLKQLRTRDQLISLLPYSQLHSLCQRDHALHLNQLNGLVHGATLVRPEHLLTTPGTPQQPLLLEWDGQRLLCSVLLPPPTTTKPIFTVPSKTDSFTQIRTQQKLHHHFSVKQVMSLEDLVKVMQLTQEEKHHSVGWIWVPLLPLLLRLE